ncbi:unnamed protein product [Paramecium sonneborni]|uniref:Uncharacterized protein n=1 Tax=Paramecium sonneborni TaxID=65129 RepID=A0A8S1P3M6_9CILI|nr:unnamed protein product [Paramecium sonneborni]
MIFDQFYSVRYQINLKIQYFLVIEIDQLRFGFLINKDETKQVSCSDDKKIIVQENKTMNEDLYLNKIQSLFSNHDTIAWYQENQSSIYLYILIKAEKFVEKKDLQISLRFLDLIQSLFPYIQNKAKQIFIIKHNKFVNILSYKN